MGIFSNTIYVLVSSALAKCCSFLEHWIWCDKQLHHGSHYIPNEKISRSIQLQYYNQI